jgi:hypothetical protein
MPSPFQIWETKLHLAIQASWSEQCWVKCIRSVCGHQYLDITPCIKAVQLGGDLEHRPLHLVVATFVLASMAFATDSVNLIEEYDTSSFSSRHGKELANHAGALSHVLLNQFRANNAYKASISSVGHRTRDQGFAFGI